MEQRSETLNEIKDSFVIVVIAVIAFIAVIFGIVVIDSCGVFA